VGERGLSGKRSCPKGVQGPPCRGFGGVPQLSPYYADMLDREGKVLDVQQVGFTQQTVDA
jgi:hypothetical protein